VGVELGHWSRGRYALLAAIFLLGACVTWDLFASELERGNDALRRGDSYAATDSYQRALGYRRDDPAALHGLARSYIGRGDGENALEVFLILRRVDPAYFEQRASTDYQVALEQAAKTRPSRGNSGMAISVPSDAVLPRPDDPQLQGRMDRDLQIRYPDGLPDLPSADNVAGAPEIAVEAPPEREAALEVDADPEWQPIPEREHDAVWIESGSSPPTGWDVWPDEGPEPADDPAHAR
jgi:hypothetical protein